MKLLDRRNGHAARPAAAAVRGRPGGVGRSATETAERVSDALRRRREPVMRHRRRIAGLTLGGMTSLGAVAAYQFGLVGHLPDPPLRFFDSDRVDASGEAYRPLAVPDAAVGLASYAATLALAGAGPADRARVQPWVPLAMAAKVLADAVGGLYLTAEQVSRHRALCVWCLLAAGASVAAVPLAVPEARLAWRQLAQRR